MFAQVCTTYECGLVKDLQCDLTSYVDLRSSLYYHCSSLHIQPYYIVFERPGGRRENDSCDSAERRTS